VKWPRPVKRAWRECYFSVAGLSEIRMLSVIFDRVPIRKYKLPDIIFSRSGSESLSVPEMLLKVWLDRTAKAGPFSPFDVRCIVARRISFSAKPEAVTV
jgi:hypothetical protein